MLRGDRKGTRVYGPNKKFFQKFFIGVYKIAVLIRFIIRVFVIWRELSVVDGKLPQIYNKENHPGGRENAGLFTDDRGPKRKVEI